MLTVKEINEVSFGKAGFSGYKPEDVDNFIDKVAASFQELLAERDAAIKQTEELAALNTEMAAKNSDSQRKLSVLAQKVEAYRTDEDGIKEAIINAQRMSKAMVKEAEQKAADIVSEARAQAEAKLVEANEEARKILQNAESDAAKAAKEYSQLAETKKTELEEIKKQVTAFRSSLLEMYKKHLECIDHIPTFRQKDEPEPAQALTVPEPGPIAVPEPEPEYEPPVEAVEPEPLPEPEPVVERPTVEHIPEPADRAEPRFQTEHEPRHAAPVQEYHEQPVHRQAQPPRAVRDRPPVQQTQNIPRAPKPMPRQSATSRRQEPQARTLNDTYNYVQEQLQPSRLPESYLEDNDLSSVGIDLNAHTNIPEALRREKSNNYSNLPFGDGVEVDGRKRRH